MKSDTPVLRYTDVYGAKYEGDTGLLWCMSGVRLVQPEAGGNYA